MGHWRVRRFDRHAELTNRPACIDDGLPKSGQSLLGRFAIISFNGVGILFAIHTQCQHGPFTVEIIASGQRNINAPQRPAIVNCLINDSVL